MRIHWLGPLFILHCAPNFTVDDNATIACTATADCPQDWSCDVSRNLCVKQLDPVPRVELPPIARQIGDVHFKLVARDGDSTITTLKIEVDAGAGFVSATTDVSEVAATSAGAEAPLVWHAASDLGETYRASVKLRVTPRDVDGNVGASVESAAFAYGNDLPVLTALAVAVPGADVVSGNAIVSFEASDSAADAIDVVSLEVDTGSGYAAIFDETTPAMDLVIPSGAVTALASNQKNNFTWSTKLTSVLEAPAARVRMRVRDAYGISQPFESTPFHLRNQTPPRVSSMRAVGADYRRITGPVGILYTLDDDENDIASVTFEYSLDGGNAFFPCLEYQRPESEGSVALATRGSVEHVFVWDGASVSWDVNESALVRATPAQPGFVGVPASVLLSRGAGAPMVAPYTTPSMYDAFGLPSATVFATGDFDGDGLLDVATNDNTTGQRWEAFNRQVYPCTGSCFAGINGNATQPAGLVVGLASADFNADGYDDLLATRDTNVLTLRMGSATGLVDATTVVGLTGALGLLLAGDFDGDLHQDLIAAKNGGLVVLFGDGTGAFSGEVPVVDSTSFQRVRVARFNADMRDDLWLEKASADLVLVATGDVAAPFASSDSGVTGRAAIGDLNADGLDDVAVGAFSTFRFLLRDAAGFGRTRSWSLGYHAPTALGLADVNGDGFADVCWIENTTTNNYSIYCRLNRGVDGSGGCSFGEPLPLYSMSDLGAFIDSADFNGDGNADLIIDPEQPVGFGVLMSREAGGMSAGVLRIESNYPGVLAYELNAETDIEGDGVPDFVFKNGNDIVLLQNEGARGVGTGRLRTTQTIETCPACDDLRGGDFDGDGLGDLWYMDGGKGYVRLGRGDGAFAARTEVAAPAQMRGLMGFQSGAAQDVDMDGDGYRDVVTNGATEGILYIYRGASSDVLQIPALVSLSGDHVTVHDLNTDGIPDVLGSGWKHSSVFNVLIGQHQALLKRRTVRAKPLAATLPRRDEAGASTFGAVPDTTVNLHIAQIAIGEGDYNLDPPGAPATAFTAPWQAFGDRRLAASKDGTRTLLTLHSRLGEFLSLDDATNQRGLVLDLPILPSFDDTTAGAAVVHVFVRTTDYAHLGDAFADQPIIQPQSAFHEVPRVTDLADGTGERFVVAIDGKGKRFVRVLLDQLGIVQAFKE